MKVQIEAHRWAKIGSLTGLIGGALLWATTGTGFAQQEELVAAGEIPFQRHCATCHGLNGKGDGVVASTLTVQPADLTQLSKKNNGEFPFWHVYRTIDGRERVRGHGTREMPIWGAEFRAETGGGTPAAEAYVRGRILELVFYLQSIQGE